MFTEKPTNLQGNQDRTTQNKVAELQPNVFQSKNNIIHKPMHQ